MAGIEAIQEALNRLAIAGVALPRIRFGAMDKFRGWFGPQTVDALRAFQRFAGIGVDAKIGDDTFAHSTMPSSPPVWAVQWRPTG